LHRAVRYAVFSGGKRLRPRLLIAVAAACKAGPLETELVLNSACAVEFLHSASLIHDDLPAFDDSPERRGRPTVHVLFGEPMAILAGDALLSRAYEVVAESPPRLAHRTLGIIRLLGAAAGTREGIIGGQSMEQPVPADASPSGSDAQAAKPAFTPDMVDRYHAMKSAALFRLATMAGAIAAGSEARDAWAQVGHYVGMAFQLADDLCDVSGHAAAAGKPVGRDAALGRPNAALVHGQNETRRRMEALLREANALASSLVAEPRPLIELLGQASSHFGLNAA
jgi:geranylgeranyl diphosphate synthase type II